MRLLRIWRERITAYALAHASKTLFWAASDIYFAFYLTEVCGIAASRMGLLMAGSYGLNALADWWLGRRLAASVRSAHAAARLQLVGALLCSGTLFLFGLTALVSPDQRLPAALLALMAFRLSYSLYDIPQNALLALAGRDAREQARMAAARLAVSGIARVTLTASFVPLFVQRSTEAQIGGFLVLVSIMALLGVAGAGLLACRLRDDDGLLEEASEARTGNGTATVLHLMMMTLSLGTTIFTQLEPYLAAWILGSRWEGVALLTAVALGTSLTQPLWLAAARHLPRHVAAISALLLAAASCAAFPFLILDGGMAVPVIGIGYGAGTGGLFFMLWTAIAARAASMHDRRGVTATLGAFAASAKIGQASAILAVGFYLQQWRAVDAHPSGPILVATMAAAVLFSLLLLILLALLRVRPLAHRRKVDNLSNFSKHSEDPTQ